MGQTQLLCTRATGLGTPQYRLARDTVTGSTHAYAYGYFGFDKTTLDYGVRITNIYTFNFYGQASRSDGAAGTIKTFLAPLETGFSDQTGAPPEVNRSGKFFEGENAILPEEGGHGLTGAVTDQNVIEKIIRNGVALCTENDVDDTTAEMKAYTNLSAHAPVLAAEWTPVVITPKNLKASASNVVIGFTYVFSFDGDYESKGVLGNVFRSREELQFTLSPDGGMGGVLGYGMPYGTTQGQFSFKIESDEPPISPNDTVYFIAAILSNSGGQGSARGSIKITTLSITLDDVHPSVTQYVGLPVAFGWRYKYNMPSGAIGGGAAQVRAEIRWRKKGDEAFITIGGIGPEMGKSVSGLPEGTIEYQIVSWDTTGGKTESAWKSFENKALAIRAADLYPAEGAKAPKHVANRFGWRVVPDEDPDFTGTLTVREAVFYWRPTGSSASQQISAGTANALTVPAETFDADTIDWWVEITANTGGKAASDPITISTVDAMSKPVAVSPVGQYVNDAAGVLFNWKHVVETGTPQMGYHLQYSTDGAAWTDIVRANGDAASYLDGHGNLPPGTVYWHVQSKNTDGVWGSFSEAAAIVVQRVPDAPQIVYTDACPIPTIGWQSVDQEGYRLTIGSFDTGWIASTDKTYTHHDILPDGVYPVTLQIMTRVGGESQTATISIEIKNVPGEAPVVHLTEQAHAVCLRWQEAAGAIFYLLRDGMPIVRTEQSTAWDYFSSGAHQYVVRTMKDGYYADSKPVVGISRVENAVVSALEPVAWVKLTVKTQSRPTHDESGTGQAAFRHFYGRVLPVGYTSGFADISNNLTWTLRPEETDSYERLLVLLGREVVYKDCFGRVRFGVLTGTGGGLTERVELSLTFTQTDYRERVDYA